MAHDHQHLMNLLLDMKFVIQSTWSTVPERTHAWHLLQGLMALVIIHYVVSSPQFQLSSRREFIFSDYCSCGICGSTATKLRYDSCRHIVCCISSTISTLATWRVYIVWLLYVWNLRLCRNKVVLPLLPHRYHISRSCFACDEWSILLQLTQQL